MVSWRLCPTQLDVIIIIDDEQHQAIDAGSRTPETMVGSDDRERPNHPRAAQLAAQPAL